MQRYLAAFCLSLIASLLASGLLCVDLGLPDPASAPGLGPLACVGPELRKLCAASSRFSICPVLQGGRLGGWECVPSPLPWRLSSVLSGASGQVPIEMEPLLTPFVK